MLSLLVFNARFRQLTNQFPPACFCYRSEYVLTALRLVPTGETVMKHWWNSDETVMKHVKSGWISNETICFMVVKHRETCWSRMKHGHETPWIRMKHCFMVMKHLESGWNSVMKHMVMKHTVSCQWNTLNQGRWSQRYLFSYIDFWFMVFHCAVSCCFIAVSCCFIAVSLMFHAVSLLFYCCFIDVSCCFIAVSRCFTALFHSVSRCFIALFHGVSRCFIALFHPVSWPWNRCSGNEPLADAVRARSLSS